MELPEIGTVFQSKYRLDRVLGEGGFARVYFAEDQGARRSVALKILKPKDNGGYADDTESRFHREVRVVANLRDPHTVTMFDFGRSADGLLFMVFEYIPGTDLSQLLKERGTLTEGETVHILEQVLRSLREAHHAGLLHRDLKPENIRIYEYMGDSLRVSLLDFGIARSAKPSSEQSAITHSGSLVGTPKYMSPEQLLEQELTAASDLYSLGLVAYEMLTGESAIGGNALSDQLRVLGSGTNLCLPPNTRVSLGLRRVIDGMIAREPRERWQTAVQVLQELQPLSGSELTGSQPLIPVARPPSGSGPLLPQVVGNTSPNPNITPPRLMPPPQTGPTYAPQSMSTYTSATTQRPLPPPDEERLSNRWLVGALVGVVGMIVAAGAAVKRFASDPEPPPMTLPRVLPTSAGKALTQPTSETTEVVAPKKNGCGIPAPFEGSGTLSIMRGVTSYSPRVHIPKGYDPNRHYPLLILLHDVQETPNTVLSNTKFGELADEKGFLIFAPKDLDLGPWSERDDVVRIQDEFKTVAKRLCVDEDRVFAFGYGAGGRAVERAACYFPEVDATATTGFRPTADEQAPCEPSNPRPHLHVAAMLDRNSPAEGGVGCMNGVGMKELAMPVSQQEEHRAAINKCGEKLEEPWATDPLGTCYAWDCPDLFVSCRVNGGRNWPGTPARGLDANGCDGKSVNFPYRDIIWRFFEEAVPTKPQDPKPE